MRAVKVWAKSFGGAGEDRATAIGVDALEGASGVYVGVGNGAGGGAYYSSVAFGGIGAVGGSSGGGEALSLQLSASNGDVQWAVGVGGSGSAEARCVSTHTASGDTFMAGSFTGSITLGGTSLSAGEGMRLTFIAKLSASGSVLWAAKYACTQVTIVIDTHGYLHAGASFSGSASFGDTDLTSRCVMRLPCSPQLVSSAPLHLRLSSPPLLSLPHTSFLLIVLALSSHLPHIVLTSSSYLPLIFLLPPLLLLLASSPLDLISTSPTPHLA